MIEKKEEPILINEQIAKLKKANLNSLYKKSGSFTAINRVAQNFAGHIENNYEKIIKILMTYESYEVAKDEIARTLDLLKNLKENAAYFIKKIGSVTSFLPRNQPLYALTCFTIVPALMASEVYARPPLVMRDLFPSLVAVLNLNQYFNNIHISFERREDFLRTRSKIKRNLGAVCKEPLKEAVIFTGTMENADKIRQQFDNKVLFIANGAGHNPIVVTETADMKKAVTGAMRVQLYNQGQDCASPNAILVHAKKYNFFLRQLQQKLKIVKIGSSFSKTNKIGPISDRHDLKRIQKILIENAEWLDETTPGIIHTKTSIVEPTIIVRPLIHGGNYDEMFSPIFFVQRYSSDRELSSYFENPKYEKNAMYITLYGTSKYIDSLVDYRFPNGKILHDESTIIRNTDLHAPGVERGTQPYGGYGRAASCISIDGRIIAKPTCPQRDIYEQLVYPTIQKEKGGVFVGVKYNGLSIDNNISFVDEPQKERSQPHHIVHNVKILSRDIFSKLNDSNLKYIINLRHTKNIKYIVKLKTKSVADIRTFKQLLSKDTSNVNKLEKLIYEIPKVKKGSKKKNKENQKNFFKDIYNLLFGQNTGPRLSTFLMSIKKTDIIHLFNI